MEEISKFNMECSSFEAWLTSAEEKVELSRGHVGKPDSLEQREAAHKVSQTWRCDVDDCRNMMIFY